MCISIVSMIASVISVFISSYASYRFTLRSKIDDEKKKIYIRFIEALYDLRSTPQKIFDESFVENILSIRTELKLFACPLLLEKISEFYSKFSICHEKYKKEVIEIENRYSPYNYGDCGEHYPYGEEGIKLEKSEKEEAKNRNTIDLEWLRNYLDEVSDLMRKDLKSSIIMKIKN